MYNIPMDRLGVDFGRVITDAANDGTDTSMFGDNYLEARPSEGVFEALADLVQDPFGNNIWIVSKARAEMRNKTKRWLEYRQLYSRTGIEPDNLLFTLTHEEKARIAGRLALTHFVDDHFRVLRYMAEIVPNRYWFKPDPAEVVAREETLSGIVIVHSWQEVREKIRNYPS